MTGRRSATDRIFDVLRPFASNWSGTLGRGDLVIPHREIPRLIQELLEAARDPGEPGSEATDLDIFEVLRESKRLQSTQELVGLLRQKFLISRR